MESHQGRAEKRSIDSQERSRDFQFAARHGNERLLDGLFQDLQVVIGEQLLIRANHQHLRVQQIHESRETSSQRAECFGGVIRVEKLAGLEKCGLTLEGLQ